jgi:hypothetical protein
VCTRGSNRALLRGPSTSPLGVMAIKYNWVCTACGATNAAGTDSCVSCKSPAVVSAGDIAARTKTQGPAATAPHSTPLPIPLRIGAYVGPIVAGVTMLLFHPQEIGLWYLVVALLLILIGPNIAVALVKRLNDP